MMGLLLVTVWSLLALYGIKKLNYLSINILIFMCIFQNIVLITASPYINKMYFNLFIIIKEFYVIFLIFIGFWRIRKITKFQWGCIVCTLLLIIYGFVHGIDRMMGILSSVRQLYLPFLFFLLGTVYFKDVKGIRKSLSFFLKIMIITAIFGWIEMSFGADFWIKLGYKSFANLKGTEAGLSPEGVHGAFYSWDLGVRIRRMASFLAEPVILGQLFAFALIISIFLKDIYSCNRTRYIAVIIFGAGLVSTLAKGGIIIALFAFAFALGEIWHRRNLSILARCCFAIILIGGIGYVVRSGTNGLIHIAGLTDNLKNLPAYPFGRGIGAVGNLGYNYGGRIKLLANGESFVGAAIGQIGIFAIIIYVYFYKNMFKALLKSSVDELFGIGKVCMWLNAGLLITSLVNNTAISFTSCFIYFIIAGGVYRTYRFKIATKINVQSKEEIDGKTSWNYNLS